MIEIHFSTPDAVEDTVERALHDEAHTKGEMDSESFKEELRAKLKKWIDYGELVTLMYDPEKDELSVKRKK